MGTKKTSDKEKIKELETLAQEVLDLKTKSRPRRPIVIEFCGSPKSGKTSSINSLNIFFKRNGFKTKVMNERAGACPINDKFNPYFNIWTSCSAIAELVTYLANSPKDLDIIIADRGIFDALCWFSWQCEHDHLDRDNFISLVNFLTMEKWRRVIDFVYVFTAKTDISLDREYATLLTRKTGSVMNPRILGEFNKSIKSVLEKYSHFFSKVEKIDTSESNQNEVSYEVTKCTLKILKETIMEQIGYLDISILEEFRNSDVIDSNNLIDKKIQIKYGLREIVEKNPKFIQPIPIAVFTNKEKDKVLRFIKKEKSLSSNSPELNKTLLYAGGHIRKEDCIEINGRETSDIDRFIAMAKATLSREINEELGISYYPNEKEPLIIWAKDHPKSKQHLAICFVSEVDFERLRIRLNKDEFIQRTGKSKSGTVTEVNDIKNEINELDSWSKIILQKVFRVKILELFS